MNNKTVMSDYELISAIKNSKWQSKKNKLIFRLYDRYKNLIYKVGHKLIKSLHLKYDYLEDYQQEAYFVLLKAIDYVDFNKINKSKEEWSFVNVYFYHLKNLNVVLRNKLVIAEINECDFNLKENTCLDDMIFRTNRTPEHIIIKKELKNKLWEQISKLETTPLIKGRSKCETDILFDLMEGKNLLDISKERGLWYNSVYSVRYEPMKKYLYYKLKDFYVNG